MGMRVLSPAIPRLMSPLPRRLPSLRLSCVKSSNGVSATSFPPQPAGPKRSSNPPSRPARGLPRWSPNTVGRQQAKKMPNQPRPKKNPPTMMRTTMPRMMMKLSKSPGLRVAASSKKSSTPDWSKSATLTAHRNCKRTLPAQRKKAPPRVRRRSTIPHR